MAKSINQVMLMGNLTRDPETRTTKSGKKVVQFGLAVGRQGTADGVDYIDVVAWEKLGELIEKYLNKGSRCIVQGRLQFNQYQGKDGSKRNKIDVIASDVTFISSKSEDKPATPNQGGFTAGQRQPEAPSQPLADVDMSQPIDLSEIPF